ncbi:MAG: hypothetical protein RSA66_08010 [Muribaculaceae bacterium]
MNEDKSYVEVTFKKLEDYCGFRIINLYRPSFWTNDPLNAFAYYWLSHGILLHNVDIEKEMITFYVDLKNEISSNISENDFPYLYEEFTKPTKEDVDYYLSIYQRDQQRISDDTILKNLFSTEMPSNTKFNQVSIKVAAIDQYFSRNLYHFRTIARHIVNLNIDKDLETGNSEIVNEIAKVKFSSYKEINNYKFATRYCYYHNPEEFPFYDPVIKDIINEHKRTSRIGGILQQDFLNYTKYKNILKKFRSYYGFEEYSLEDITIYLYYYGMSKFPKKYAKLFQKE